MKRQKSNQGILSPDPLNFRSFGKIIGYPHKSSKGKVRNLWCIVHVEPARVGWRVAYLVLRDRTLGQMGCHPHSDETFEPVKGRSLLFVSLKKDLKGIKCFYLDKPLIVYKGVWHNLITLDPETEIKITENNHVASRHWPLGFRCRSYQDLLRCI